MTHKSFLFRVLYVVCMYALVFSPLFFSLERQASASANPTSCQNVRDADPNASDGDYTLSYKGTSIQIYCANMSQSPQEYINLVHSGGAYNYSKYAAGGAREGTDAITNFTRIRINLQTLVVDTADLTFSSNNGGSVWAPGTPITSMYFGHAGDCISDGSQAGSANIDLSGTPFAVVSNQFIVQGWNPMGNTSYSSNNQIVNLTGGGYCGGNDSGDYIQLMLLPAISITVTDTANNAITKPIQAVAVGNSTQQQVNLVRDSFGNYKANNLPLDNYTITISAPGYISYTLQTETLSSGQGFVTSVQLPHDLKVLLPETDINDVLYSELQQALHKTDITVYDMSTLTELNLYYGDGNTTGQIVGLTGLQYATQLTTLRLGGNKISDVTPLAGLKNLRALELRGNNISDISPLANLTNLTQYLDISNNQITNLTALANMTSLQELFASNNQIQDVSSLTNLTSLTDVELSNNRITNITSLSNLPNLNKLYLDNNAIIDVNPLANLMNNYGMTGSNPYININSNLIDYKDASQRSSIKSISQKLYGLGGSLSYDVQGSNDLVSLAVNGQIISPSSTNQYNLDVNADVSSVTVTAITYDPQANVSINSTLNNSDNVTQTVNLNPGSNSISISVNPTKGNTYSLTVNRAILTSLNAGIDPQHLTNILVGNQSNYNFTVTNAVYYYVQPVINSGVLNPIVTVNGMTVQNNVVTPVYLQDFANTQIDVTVSAQGISPQYYHLLVYKDSGRISNISFNNQSAIYNDNGFFQLTVPATTKLASLSVSFGDMNSYISGVAVSYPSSVTGVTYTSKSILLEVTANTEYLTIIVNEPNGVVRQFGLVIVKADQIAGQIGFIDTDPRAGYIHGPVTWSGLGNESSIKSYLVYYLDALNNKLSLIGEVPKGSAYSLGLQSQVPPTGAVSIGVFVKDTNGYVAATGMDIFLLVDNTSSNQVRIALKQRLFPSITQVGVQNIVKLSSNVPDLTGDGVFNQDDVQLLLSLIGPRFVVPIH